MTESEGKGFAGLSSLTTNIEELNADPQLEQVESVTAHSRTATDQSVRGRQGLSNKTTGTPKRKLPPAYVRPPKNESKIAPVLATIILVGLIGAAIVFGNHSDQASPQEQQQPYTGDQRISTKREDAAGQSEHEDKPYRSTTALRSGNTSADQGPERGRVTFDRPAINDKSALSMAQLRWCLREQYKINQQRPTVSTRSANKLFNSRVDRYNKYCDGKRYSKGMHERALGQLQKTRKQRREAEIERMLAANKPSSASIADDEQLVSEIQRLLNKAGYNSGAVDGIYGANTKSAIKAFQRDIGVPITGEVTPQIRQLLISTARVTPNNAMPLQTPALDKSALPLPRSGYTKKYTTKPAIAPLTIETEGSDNYLIRLRTKQFSRRVLDIFIHGGDTVTVDVPIGVYTLHYAAGNTWYGFDHLFGSKTSYSKANSILRFRREGSRVIGYTLRLYKLSDGNLTTSTITAGQF